MPVSAWFVRSLHQAERVAVGIMSNPHSQLRMSGGASTDLRQMRMPLGPDGACPGPTPSLNQMSRGKSRG